MPCNKFFKIKIKNTYIKSMKMKIKQLIFIATLFISQSVMANNPKQLMLDITVTESNIVTKKLIYASIYNVPMEISLDKVIGYLIDNEIPPKNKINILIKDNTYNYSINFNECYKEGFLNKSSDQTVIQLCNQEKYITVNKTNT
jgi:hypothetical protein